MTFTIVVYSCIQHTHLYERNWKVIDKLGSWRENTHCRKGYVSKIGRGEEKYIALQLKGKFWFVNSFSNLNN